MSLATVFADVTFDFGFIIKSILNPNVCLASSCFIS